MFKQKGDSQDIPKDEDQQDKAIEDDPARMIDRKQEDQTIENDQTSTEILCHQNDLNQMDVMFLHYYWSILGIGFSQSKVVLLSTSIQRLKRNSAVENCR